jgi:ketoreductase RED2
VGLLTDRVAVVTGSSGGIGEGIARVLAEHGARIVVNSRSSEVEGKRVAAELPDAVYVRADVSDDAEARRLVAETVDHYGRLDLLVNNAGVPEVVPRGDLEALGDDNWHGMLAANVIGPFHMIRAALPALRESGRGSILNVASVDGLITRRARSSLAYCSSKAALIHLSRLLAVELAPDVRVNVLVPGSTENQPHPPDVLERIVASTPMGRLATVREMGEMCVWLALATHTTGQVAQVDGGTSLAHGRP